MIDFLLLCLRDAGLAFVIAVGFGTLFNLPKRTLLAAGLLGGLGHMIRFILLHFDVGLVSATLCGAVFIGLVGIYVSHIVHSPPVVFSMPACITMIPGLYAYRTMLGFIDIIEPQKAINDPAIIPETMHNLVLTSSLLFTLAIGICIGVLLFRKKSTKDIWLPKL